MLAGILFGIHAIESDFLRKMSIGMSIFSYTAPVLLWGIGTLNIVGIFLLPLVFWIILLFMSFGGILITNGTLRTFLREPLVALVHVPMTIFLNLSTFLSAIPLSTITIASIKRLLYGLISFITVMILILLDFTPEKHPSMPKK